MLFCLTIFRNSLSNLRHSSANGNNDGLPNSISWLTDLTVLYILEYRFANRFTSLNPYAYSDVSGAFQKVNGHVLTSLIPYLSTKWSVNSCINFIYVFVSLGKIYSCHYHKYYSFLQYMKAYNLIELKV